MTGLYNNISQKSQATLRAVRGLPLRIDYDVELIESYTTERNAIQTEKQLQAFTRHWNSIWKIPWDKRWSQTREEAQLVSGRYDSLLALRCIYKNSRYGVGCKHLNKGKQCISADIMAPAFLMRMYELKESFVAPDGVILLQLIRVIHNDLKTADPDDIVTYLNDWRMNGPR